MDKTPHEIVDRIRRNLYYVFREAEMLRPAELTLRSSEFQAATQGLDMLIANRERFGLLKLKIGRTASFGLNIDQTKQEVMPGETYDLVQKYMYPVEVFGTPPVMQPYYGDGTYFSLPMMGQLLDDTAELDLVKPESSSSM